MTEAPEAAIRLTSNVTKLPVLKHQELFPPSNLIQPSDGLVPKVIDNVRVCLQHAYVISNIFRDLQQLRGGVDIRRHAKIRPFDVHQSQKVGRQRREIGLLRSLGIGLEPSGMALRL